MCFEILNSEDTNQANILRPEERKEEGKAGEVRSALKHCNACWKAELLTCERVTLSHGRIWRPMC